MQVRCLNAGGYVDLVVGKDYQTISDDVSESWGLMRVVDESGEDYLYPVEWFEILATSNNSED